MKIDNLGRCILDTESALEYLYKGGDLFDANLSDEAVKEFNDTIQKLKDGKRLSRITNPSKEDFDSKNQSNWYFPDEYKTIDVDKYINELVNTDKERERVNYEMELYRKFNLYTVLRYLIYLVDTMRKNNVVWGVGRGSSVSSYVLYLIGVHKVNSIKYGLDIHEFLR
jgi:DNA polymerase III alpha subunit